MVIFSDVLRTHDTQSVTRQLLHRIIIVSLTQRVSVAGVEKFFFSYRCHAERSDETEMLRFAQHDHAGEVSATSQFSASFIAENE
jgi:hypothetical protein